MVGRWLALACGRLYDYSIKKIKSSIISQVQEERGCRLEKKRQGPRRVGSDGLRKSYRESATQRAGLKLVIIFVVNWFLDCI